MDQAMRQIMEHYKDPENYGLLTDADAVVSVFNPLCGDKLVLSIKLSGEKIVAVGFEGSGCSISQAAMSMLSELLLDANLSELKDKISKDDVVKMVGLELTPMRMRCAWLSWEAVQKLLEEKKS